MKKLNELQGKFDSGQMTLMPQVIKRCLEESGFKNFVAKAINRYIFQDWGNLPTEEWNRNNKALSFRRRIDGFYQLNDSPEFIWITTDWKKMQTIVQLFENNNAVPIPVPLGCGQRQPI